MNYFTAIRLNALNAVTNKQDEEYSLRSIFRFYSKTFHTPLHIVEELPIYDVLVAYYETTYEGFKEPEIEEEKANLLETEEEQIIKLRRMDEEHLMHHEMAKATEAIDGLLNSGRNKNKIPGLGDLSGTGVVSGDKKPSLPSGLPKFKEGSLPESLPSFLPENIKMRFLPDNEDFPMDMDPLEFRLLDEPEPE